MAMCLKSWESIFFCVLKLIMINLWCIQHDEFEAVLFSITLFESFKMQLYSQLPFIKLFNPYYFIMLNVFQISNTLCVLHSFRLLRTLFSSTVHLITNSIFVMVFWLLKKIHIESSIHIKSTYKYDNRRLFTEWIVTIYEIV